MRKFLNDDEKLDSVFDHIGGLYEKIQEMKSNPYYKPFTEIPDDKPNEEKCLREEILQFSQFAIELNGKTGTYFLASQANKKAIP
jgi:hypothetical protein